MLISLFLQSAHHRVEHFYPLPAKLHDAISRVVWDRIFVVHPAPDRAVRNAERARKLTSPLLAIKSEARFAQSE